jgi:hypothetical protein
LATILQRVSAPLKKADLLAVANYLIGHLSYSQLPALAKRHKVEAKKDSASAQERHIRETLEQLCQNSLSCETLEYCVMKSRFRKLLFRKEVVRIGDWLRTGMSSI